MDIVSISPYIHRYIYGFMSIGVSIRQRVNPNPLLGLTPRPEHKLAFTRYCFTSNKPLLWESVILVLPPPLAKPTLLQYHCTTIAQYTPPSPTPLLYAIHHTILVMGISCKGQSTRSGRRVCMVSG